MYNLYFIETIIQQLKLRKYSFDNLFSFLIDFLYYLF